MSFRRGTRRNFLLRSSCANFDKAQYNFLYLIIVYQIIILKYQLVHLHYGK
jgi:hypothetical protein